MDAINRKALVTTLAVWAVSVGSATSFAELTHADSKGSHFSWGASQESGLWFEEVGFEEVEITYLVEFAVREQTRLENKLADLTMAMPMAKSFKTDKEYRSAVSAWEDAVDATMNELDILRDDIDALIIFTTSTDHISKLSGTDLGSGR